MAEVFFNGAQGRLEGRFHKSENPRAPLVLVLHPHAKYGGSMNNRITYAIFQAFVNMGFSVLRFNYRGVGGSQGEMDGSGAGELADAIVALDWLQNMDSEASVCWIAGYSFGAYVAAQVLMRRPEVKGFVFVSPPANTCDFDFLSPCPASGLIIQGGQDEFVDEPSVSVLAEQLMENKLVQVKYKMLEAADHNYSHHLKPMYDLICKEVPQIKLGPLMPDLSKKASKQPIVPNDDYWEEE